MDLQAIWLVVIVVSGPIGAVVGFALQVRKLKQELLRTSLLEIELREAQARLEQAESIIVRATPEEIKAYGASIERGQVMFSRGPDINSRPTRSKSRWSRWHEVGLEGLVVGLFFAVIAYLLFDLFRVGRWALILLM
jgi:hypothetical protein